MPGEGWVRGNGGTEDDSVRYLDEALVSSGMGKLGKEGWVLGT